MQDHKMHYTPSQDKQLKSKFKGRSQITARYTPRTPVSPEREYQKFCNEFMKELKTELLKELPKIQKEYRQEYELRQDSMSDLMSKIDKAFSRIKDRLKGVYQGDKLRRKIERYARLAKKMSVKEFKKSVRTTFGLDVDEDYYNGDFMKNELDKWISENVDLISTLPNQSLDKMKGIIKDGYKKGKSTTDMTKEIMQAYGMEKSHAKFIARDQIEMLCGQITKMQQQDAGITKFKWSTSGDERVRKSHKDLDGKIFSWDKPPRNERGEAIIPGSDYNCRCVAIPVFDFEALSLPLIK